MGPLLDKLARQKPVRVIFETIRAWDKQSDDRAKVRAKIPTILAIVGLLLGPFVLFTVWPLSVWLLDANNNAVFAPPAGCRIFSGIGVAFGIWCLWRLPISFKMKLWVIIPYMLLFGWLLMWYSLITNMMLWGF
jgi:hypothetical protein